MSSQSLSIETVQCKSREREREFVHLSANSADKN